MRAEDVTKKAMEAANAMALLHDAASWRDVVDAAEEVLREARELAELESYFPGAGESLLSCAWNLQERRFGHAAQPLRDELRQLADQLIGARDACRAEDERLAKECDQ